MYSSPADIMGWYTTELEVLESSPLVTLHIYATCRTSSAPTSGSSICTLPSTEKSSPLSIDDTPAETVASPSDSENYDIEKHPETEFQSPRPSTVIKSGRPHVAQFITEMVGKADANDRITIATCGPDSLMHATRKAVAGCIKADGPSLELHCEQFGF